MGLLEVKHGLLQIAETLDFLHNNARLIHRALSPEVITSLLCLLIISKTCTNENMLWWIWYFFFSNFFYWISLWKHCLQNVLITSSGAWKLGGFGFAISADSNTGDMTNAQAFHYAVSEILKISDLPSHFRLSIISLAFCFLLPDQVFDFPFCVWIPIF